MFETLHAASPDGILALMDLYRADPRADKLDLGVGVYKNEQGAPPVMRAVRAAELRLHETQATKTYLGMAGDVVFGELMTGLVFGGYAERSRLRAVQTPGGTGALRLLADLVRMARPDATVWTPDPTWANHLPILHAAGLSTRTYPYYDPATAGIRFDAMVETLKTAPAGDVVLLHGCCHNPTGADLDARQWQEIANVIVQRGLTPFVDLAYQGFGEGLEEDAAGVRILAATVPEMLVAASCSKNFSVYRDRAGTALLLARSAPEARIAGGQMTVLARVLWSMPPDHPAACVRIVLEDNALREDWMNELEAVRRRMVSLRKGLADALRRQSNSGRFDFVARQRGMFSRLGLTADQVARLRADHGVYMVGDSRFNVAGLKSDRLDELAANIVSVL